MGHPTMPRKIFITDVQSTYTMLQHLGMASKAFIVALGAPNICGTSSLTKKLCIGTLKVSKVTLAAKMRCGEAEGLCFRAHLIPQAL